MLRVTSRTVFCPKYHRDLRNHLWGSLLPRKKVQPCNVELALLCGSKRGRTACFLLRQTQRTIAQESSPSPSAKPWQSSCSLCRASECNFSTAAALHPAGWCSCSLLHSRRRRERGTAKERDPAGFGFLSSPKIKNPFFSAGGTAAEKYVSFVSCVVAQGLQLGRVEAFSHLPVRGDS